MSFTARTASATDAEAITAIYNESIADRVATFETKPRRTEQIVSWFDERHPIVLVENGAGIVAFASTSNYRGRPCYSGIAESRSMSRGGIAARALAGLRC
jgi:L-amino acid N-acyltransferase YncA